MSNKKVFKSSISYDQETKEAIQLLKKNGVNISFEFRKMILEKVKQFQKIEENKNQI